MSRVDIPEEERKDFFCYIDEFQNFASDSFVNILSEARKYRLALILSHQYVAQLGTGTETKVKDAVFGNVGTMVVFRVGAEDAEFLEMEFTPDFIAEDFVNLGKYNIYVKLMIDGIAGRPFSANTLPPIVFPYENLQDSPKETIIKVSRERYSVPRTFVEEKITQWTEADQPTAQRQPGIQTVPPSAQTQMLYDARCSNCGKDTKVVFPPDGKRPVYCKSCRNKLKKAQEHKSPGPTGPTGIPQQGQAADSGSIAVAKEISLKEALEKGPTLFYTHRGKEAGEAKRKEVDKEALKKVLGKALQDHRKTKKGQLQEGETVYF
jgi:CxxC-x17-CxxC domain-containing protein